MPDIYQIEEAHDFASRASTEDRLMNYDVDMEKLKQVYAAANEQSLDDGYGCLRNY